MRIGIFDPYLDTLSGGEKYMLTLASCLAKKHEVSIFWKPSTEVEIKEKAKQKLGLDLNSVPFVPNIFSPNYPTVYRLLSTKNYDGIVFLSDGSIPLVLCKLFVHFQYPVEWIGNVSLRTKLKIARVTKVICNSSFTKSYIDEKYGVDSVVVYPPVEIKKIYYVEKQPIILNVGRFGTYGKGSSYKKQDILVEVFKKMVEKGVRNWRLVFVISVSQNSELAELRRKAQGCKIDFIVNPKNEELWNLYAKASIYWHAAGFGEDAKKHPERLEHFGITTVEAMVTGAVPVVFNGGGQKEIVEDGKNGFLWNTTDELIQKTERLINDKKLLRGLLQEAKERAKIFGSERFCNEIQSIIA